MSVQDYERFASLLTTENLRKNPEMKERLKQAVVTNNPDALLQIGREHGCNFTVEDIRAFQDKHGEELSDEDLQNVAGGGFDFALIAAAVQAGVVAVYGGPTVAYAAPVVVNSGSW